MEAKEKKEEGGKKVAEGTLRRKRAKKSRKMSRWSGLMLFLVLFLLGFLFWIGGEIKEGDQSEFKKDNAISIPSTTNYDSGSVIIIE